MQIKNRQQLLGIVAISALVLWAIDSLVVSPLYSTWKARQETIHKLSDTLNRNRRLYAQKDELNSRWEHMRTNTFPTDIAAANEAIYRAFERWSTASGIAVSSIQPRVKQSEAEYTTLDCGADTAATTMDKVARFMHELEKDPLAIKIDSVDITSHDNNGQQLSLSLQISGLLLLPNEK
jgi:hypothetical protein